MEITHPNENDIPQLAQIEKEISIISFGNKAIIDLEFHEKKLLKALKYNKNGMYVLKLGSNIDGFLWMDSRTNSLTNEIYINFKSLYISDNFKGTQEAENLLEFGLEYCRKIGAKNIIGKVHTNNIPMRSLYKKFNFQATHITMELNLSEEN